MRSLIAAGTILILFGSALAQQRPEAKSISDVTVSIAGDAHGLGAYTEKLRTAIKQAWIDRWPGGAGEPGRFVAKLRINQAGYLNYFEGPGAPPLPQSLLSGDSIAARDYRRERMHRAVMDAVHSVFIGLPPAPPDDYSNGAFTVVVTFVVGTEQPQL